MLTTEDLNKLFMSKNPEDIFNFYSYFERTEDLVKWMTERHRIIDNVNVIESNENDIVVVIPTTSFDGNNALDCRNTIFPGSTIVFVSSGDNNPDFNYAYSCNVGIKKALEYDPEWIVLSNDDMIKEDHPDILKEELHGIDSEETDIVFTKNSDNMYHSYPVVLGESTIVRNSYLRLSGADNKKQAFLEKKFEVSIVPSTNFNKKGIFKRTVKFTNIGSFGIFSSKFIRENGSKLFDDNYANELEEVELSYKVKRDNRVINTINYRIGDRVGSSLGTGSVRKFRAIASRAYFNYKIRNGLFDFKWNI